MRRWIAFIAGTFFLQGCSVSGQLIEDEQRVTVTETLKYYLYYPPEYEERKDENFGILLFLHGGGESGQELNTLKKDGPPKMMAEGYPFPFLVLAPQNPHEKQWWDIRAVKRLLETIVENNRVDRNRIYLTGLSRGGSAAWEMAVQFPNTFAAMAVVCGMAPTPYAHWLNNKMPIWVFHGEEDQVIPVSESDVMVEKLKQLNFEVRYTRYEGVGHNSWEKAYTTDALYSWMANQRKQ